MNGLELSRRYYEEYGIPMLDSFPDVKDKIAVGLTGSGSECYGFDDECSRDHDFEPGFCLFLPEESVISRRDEFLLERAYAALPDSYLGISREKVGPVGGSRRGVVRIGEFFMSRIGSEDGVLDWRQWLSIPPYMFAEATNGELFADPYGKMTSVRSAIARYPADVRKKRLAGHLLLMAQSGPYNYPRCLRHGEPAAAQLAAHEFVRSAIQVVFLLNDRYCPYYKWSFRAMRTLPVLGGAEERLSSLMTGDDRKETVAEEKKRTIEEFSDSVCDALREGGFTEDRDRDLERQAYRVNDRISDPTVRNLHILAAVGD